MERGSPREGGGRGVKGGGQYILVSISERIPSWIGFVEVKIIFDLSLRAMMIRPLFCNFGCCFVCISPCCCLRQGLPQFAKELHLPRHKTHRKSYYCVSFLQLSFWHVFCHVCFSAVPQRCDVWSLVCSSRILCFRYGSKVRFRFRVSGLRVWGGFGFWV